MQHFFFNGRGTSLLRYGLSLSLAALLPLLFLEAGNFIYSWMTVRDSAREAAQVAASGDGDEEGRRMTVIEETAMEHLSPLDGRKKVTVTSWPGPDAVGPGIQGSAGGPCQQVEVKVDYVYKTILPLVTTLLPNDLILTGTKRLCNGRWRSSE
jgi:hypothetical protein